MITWKRGFEDHLAASLSGFEALLCVHLSRSIVEEQVSVPGLCLQCTHNTKQKRLHLCGVLGSCCVRLNLQIEP